MHEVLQDLLVGCIAQGYGIEVVLLHELIEEVGTEHHGLRDHHLRILILVEFGMTLDDVIEECQTTSLTSQRALTDTGEMAISIEFQTIEHRHYTDVLHTTILYDGIEDDLAMGIHILEFMPGDMLQKCRHGEDGTGTEPTAHVVSRHVVKHRIARNLEDVILQLLQRRHTRHLLLCHRVTENKVTEAHVFLNQFMEVHIKFR